MVKLKQLKNVSKLHSFLGLVGYYQRIVKGFSLIASPLSKLLCKSVPFKWSEEHHSSFEKLKSVLIQASIFIQPESGKEFVIYTHHTLA